MFKKIFKKKSFRYSFAPQTKFYDSLSFFLHWKPFLMFSNFPNIRSQYCNTDSFGLRYNNFNKSGKYQNADNSILMENVSEEKKNAVIIGSSFAFGFGSTSDQRTISNYLTKKSMFHFFNLGTIGFSGFQEIIHFLSMLKKLENIKKIIIISGLNDSFLPYYIKEFDENLGPFFSNSQFLNSMAKKSLNWKTKIIKFVYNNILKKKINWNKMYQLHFHKEVLKEKYALSDYKRELDPESSLKFFIDRNLKLWSVIAKGMDVEIDYVIQPVAVWCQKQLSTEEEKIFKEIDQSATATNNISKLIDLKKYNLIRNLIPESCEKYGIRFMDCNENFRKNNYKYNKEWLFVDRVHLNDKGYEYVSESLLSLI